MSEQIVTVGDLKVMMGIIAGAAQRGGVWSADDLSRVGALYNKLATIITEVEAKNAELQENADNQQKSNA